MFPVFYLVYSTVHSSHTITCYVVSVFQQSGRSLRNNDPVMSEGQQPVLCFSDVFSDIHDPTVLVGTKVPTDNMYIS